jgi:hypothetical protein
MSLGKPTSLKIVIADPTPTMTISGSSTSSASSTAASVAVADTRPTFPIGTALAGAPVRVAISAAKAAQS